MRVKAILGLRRSGGFTLVELMIVVVVVSILASIAIPSYIAQIQKGRRVEAKAALTQISNMQEQFRTEQNRFTADLTDLGFGAVGWNTTENSFYRTRVVPPVAGCPIATCFQLEVQALAGPQFDDDWRYELWSDGRKRRRKCPSGVCSGGWLLDWKK